MLRWALIFLVIACVAGFLGFTGLAAGASMTAKILFILSAGLFAIFLMVGLTLHRKIPEKL